MDPAVDKAEIANSAAVFIVSRLLHADATGTDVMNMQPTQHHISHGAPRHDPKPTYQQRKVQWSALSLVLGLLT